jgi:hypothetical protein
MVARGPRAIPREGTMHFHTPFHPFQNHPVTYQTVQIANLFVILLGVALVLLFSTYAE